jgi:uncharacterized membrane protein
MVVVEDVPDEMIAWRSADHSQMLHEGWVEFRDAADAAGTLVTASITYVRRKLVIRAILSRLFQGGVAQTHRELQHFKRLREANRYRPPCKHPNPDLLIISGQVSGPDCFI